MGLLLDNIKHLQGHGNANELGLVTGLGVVL
jgi:hypothetical protein